MYFTEFYIKTKKKTLKLGESKQFLRHFYFFFDFDTFFPICGNSFPKYIFCQNLFASVVVDSLKCGILDFLSDSTISDFSIKIFVNNSRVS